MDIANKYGYWHIQIYVNLKCKLSLRFEHRTGPSSSRRLLNYPRRPLVDQRQYAHRPTTAILALS